MYCHHCGQTVPAENRFCQHCGSPLAADALPPIAPQSANSPASRMKTHVKALAWLHVVFGALGCIAGLIVFLIFSLIGRQVVLSPVHNDSFFASIPGPGAVLAGFCLLFSLPVALAGYGLLTYRPWARILALILCFLNLLNIPLGTALGAYGLWVLLSSEGQRFYQHQASLSQEG